MVTNNNDASSLQVSSSDRDDIGGKPNKRKKKDGQVQGPREGERNRKVILVESRRRAKGINDGIAKLLIEWGSYDPCFLTSGTAGEKELYDFLQQLEKVSTFAKTRVDITAQLLSRLRKLSKLDILAVIQSELLDLPQGDIYLLTDAKSLTDALSQPFQVPLLHQVTASYLSFASNINFHLQELLTHLSDDKGAPISVYDYTIKNPAERTRQTTVSELLLSFQAGDTCEKALNFLDIKNCMKIQFCPSPIVLGDITSKLDALTHCDKGKTGSEWRAEQPREFFLASMRNSISTIHVDTSAMVTWVLVPEGRKIWYFPQYVSSQAVRWLAEVGSQTPEDYGGWVKVELRQGDLLVMPPSFPHAVFTPEDCPTVGGQFYTAGHMGHSIEGLKLQEDHPDISNEDLHDSVYSILARVLNECGPVITSFEKSRIVSSQSLFPKMLGPTVYDKHSKGSLIDILKSQGVSIPPKARMFELLEFLKTNCDTQVACTSRETFLEAFWKLCNNF